LERKPAREQEVTGVLQSVWTDEGIRLRDVEPPALAAGWVRLKVEACGICGSDLHRYRSPRPGAAPTTPGHELSGTVIQTDAPIPDELYVVEPWLTCRVCDYCLSGNSQNCRRGTLVGVHVAGGLSEFIDVPVTSLHRSDASFSPLEASLTEPFAVCTRSIHLAHLKLDSRVLVLGGGSLGLISGLLARDTAVRVAVSARYPAQKDAARSLGLEPVAEEDVTALAKDFEPDVVIETVGGSANTIEQAIQACRPGGRIVVLGLFSTMPPFDARALVQKELLITGSRVFGQGEHGPEFEAATRMLPRYRRELAVLQTHQFPLARIAEAFAVSADKNSESIKVTVLPGA
jgi:(R,R)-butanediol dehydrogenase / meso-butanediol dehydrogenase / diacetyl reductase